jgi:hypothetical protein
MHSIERAVMAFSWFIRQSSTVGGLGASNFWIPFLILIVFLIWAFRRAEIERRKVWILSLFPLMWICIGLLGGLYWVDWQQKPIQHPPPWVNFFVTYGLVVFLITAAIAIWYLRGARLLASIFIAIHLYFMVAMSFLAGMAVTGVWL